MVRYAAQNGLRVLPQATGHGAAGEVTGDTIILDTARLTEISIDPVTRTAQSGAGATWAAVNAAAQQHGLLGRAGSAPGTPAIAAGILNVAAAPTSPLSMIELRNTDSTAASPAGAMTAAPGPFLLHAVGLAPTSSAREPVDQALGNLRRASQPADLGRSAVSLAEGRLGDADSLEPADRERLAAIKAELDPGDVIAASRFLRDRNGTPLTAAR